MEKAGEVILLVVSNTAIFNLSLWFNMFRGVLDVMQVHSVGEPQRGSGELRTGACRASAAGHR